jgi:N-ethylmaleimide reductase
VAAGAETVGLRPPLRRRPDLVERLRRNGPYNEGQRATYYGGGEAGYTDYPTL